MCATHKWVPTTALEAHARTHTHTHTHTHTQPLLWPDHRQRQPGQGLRDVTGRCGQTDLGAPVCPGQLGVLTTTGAHSDPGPATEHPWVGVWLWGRGERRREGKSFFFKGDTSAKTTTKKKRKFFSLVAFSSHQALHTHATFFLLKTERERALIYFSVCNFLWKVFLLTPMRNSDTKRKRERKKVSGQIIEAIFCN